VTNTASLKDLNGKIKTREVEMIAFRPNIVLSGPSNLLPPWIEDEWREIEINGQGFTFSSPAQRCTVPTVIPNLGKRDPNHEPTTTLRQFRAMTSTAEKEDGKVYFGQWTIQAQPEGIIQLGDRVTVIKSKPPGQFVQKARED